ncbi:MAG: ABC transporter substrate-binding protein [Desulfomonile tiedjei]|nr:ABC transporter substrate-binding protein [Desulfomonile tiedjei]
MYKTRTVILLILATLLLLPPATVVSAEEDLTIASVLPLTGPYGPAGVQGAAAQKDCVAIINDEGGINGKKLKYVIEDGQYKIDVAMAAFRKIMANDNPMVFFGESTEQAKTIAPEMKNTYKMLFGTAGSSSELADTAMNPYSFVTGPTYGDQFGILLKYIAKEKPGAKVAFFYSDTEFGKDPIKFGRLMCGRLRLKLVSEGVVPPGSKDLSAQIGDLKKTDPDYVIFQGFLYEPVPQVIKACRDLGMKCKFMGTFYGSSKWILDKLGPLAEGYYGISPYMWWWDDDVPTIKKIKDYTAKNYPDVKFRDLNYTRGFMSVLIAAECMRRADKAGELNREGVAKALQTIKNFDSGGLSAPWTVRNNRFPVAKVWSANPEKGIYEPASEWIRLDKYD